MQCCQRRRPPPAPARLAVVNGVSAAHTAPLALGLEAALDAALWHAADLPGPSTAGPPRPTPTQLARDWAALRAAQQAVRAGQRPAVVALCDPHESFALALRTAPRLRAEAVPLTAVLVHTPLARLVDDAVRDLRANPAGAAEAVAPLLDYPVLFRGTPTRQAGYLEFLRPSDVRRAFQQLGKAATGAPAEAALKEVETHLLASLALTGKRGVYVVPRSPVYDVVVNSTDPLRENCAKVLHTLRRQSSDPPTLGASQLLDAKWTAHGGGSALCKECFRAIAAEDLALLADPRAPRLAGRPPCPACLRAQAAVLAERPTPGAGYRIPRFAGTASPPTATALPDDAAPPRLGGTRADLALPLPLPMPLPTPSITDAIGAAELSSRLTVCMLPTHPYPLTEAMSTCMVQQLFAHGGDVTSSDFQMDMIKCAATHMSKEFAGTILEMVGAPIHAMGCLAQISAEYGLWNPHFIEVVIEDGKTILWDLSGSVWGLFSNLSTAFGLLGDLVWLQAFLPRVLFGFVLGSGLGDALVASGAALQQAGAAAAGGLEVAVTTTKGAVGAASQAAVTGIGAAEQAAEGALAAAETATRGLLVTTGQAAQQAVGGALQTVATRAGVVATATQEAATAVGAAAVGAAQATEEALAASATAVGAAVGTAETAAANAAQATGQALGAAAGAVGSGQANTAMAVADAGQVVGTAAQSATHAVQDAGRGAATAVGDAAVAVGAAGQSAVTAVGAAAQGAVGATAQGVGQAVGVMGQAAGAVSHAAGDAAGGVAGVAG